MKAVVALNVLLGTVFILGAGFWISRMSNLSFPRIARWIGGRESKPSDGAAVTEKEDPFRSSERCRMAFHVMGHAAVALAIGSGHRLERIGLSPDGCFLLDAETPLIPGRSGSTFKVKGALEKDLAILLGGRAAEALFFDEVSTGDEHDLRRATEISRAMVMRYGMSKSLGMVTYDEQSHHIFGPRIGEKIDAEVRGTLDEAFCLACQWVNQCRDFIEAGAELLLANEVLTKPEVRKLWRAHPPSSSAAISHATLDSGADATLH